MLAGFGTILVPPATGDMDEYIHQLARLRDLQPHLAFPSHGPVIALPENKFNHYIKQKNLTNKYSLIANGEKIKFLYLKKPNLIQENVLSFIQDFPHELGLDKYIDYDLQFEKSFVEPLKTILDAIGWNVEKTVNLELFFT
mgnify:CR=1 FL=1